MSDIHKQKTPVTKLAMGMFVTALDRPWLGTPFLLEGILLENQEQIDIMNKLCQFVYVDHTVSVGEHFIAPAKREVGIKREAGVNYVKTSTKLTKLAKQNPSQQKFTFYNILKEIQASNQANQASSGDQNNTDNILLNIQNINNQVHTAGADEEDAPVATDDGSIVGRVKEDISQFLSGLTSWGNKSKSSKSKTQEAAQEEALEQGELGQVTIFEDASPVEEEIAEIYPTYAQSQIATREIFEALAHDQKIDITHVDEALDSMVASI